VLASGTSYGSELKPSWVTSNYRNKKLYVEQLRIQQAASIMIIGGGK
jgi:hypothetical protein